MPKRSKDVVAYENAKEWAAQNLELKSPPRKPKKKAKRPAGSKSSSRTAGSKSPSRATPSRATRSSKKEEDPPQEEIALEESSPSPEKKRPAKKRRVKSPPKSPLSPKASAKAFIEQQAVTEMMSKKQHQKVVADAKAFVLQKAKTTKTKTPTRNRKPPMEKAPFGSPLGVPNRQSHHQDEDDGSEFQIQQQVRRSPRHSDMQYHHSSESEDESGNAEDLLTPQPPPPINRSGRRRHSEAPRIINRSDTRRKSVPATHLATRQGTLDDTTTEDIDEYEAVDEPTKTERCLGLLKRFMLVVFAVFTFGALVLLLIGTLSLSEPQGAPCYTTSSDDAHAVCGQSNNIVPCPIGAVCSNGELFSCGSYAELVDGACQVTEDAQQQTDAILSVIEKYNQDYVCNPSSKNPYHVSSKLGRPMYLLAPILEALQMTVDSDLLRMSKSNLMVDNNKGNEVLVGLHPSVAINQSIACFAKSSLRKTVGFFVGLAWGAAMVVLSCWYSFYKESPGLTVAITVVGFVVLWYMRHFQAENERNRKIDADYRFYREAALEHLVNDQGDVSEAGLFDHLVSDLSRTERSYIAKSIWPKVKRAIASDNRVEVSTGMEGGKSLNYWRWNFGAAAIRRNSGGSPN